jgi:hypothetical protein
METIDGILGSTMTAKQKETAFACLIESQGGQLSALVKRFPGASASDQGTIMATLETVSKRRPTSVLLHARFVIEHIEDAQPRVRWEASRVVGNLAATHAPIVRSAVPALLRSARHEGTVVRWSAAFALSELALNDAAIARDLVPRLEALAHRETGGGIRKMYERALKRLAPTPGAARRPRKPPRSRTPS